MLDSELHQPEPNNGKVPNFTSLETAKIPVSLNDIDALLDLIPQDEVANTIQEHSATSKITEAPTAPSLLSEIDDLIGEVHEVSREAEKEVKGWDLERKRKEAASTSEAFVLDLLASDPNPLVRALVGCNPRSRPDFLTRLANEQNPYLQLLVANNPSAEPDILDHLAGTAQTEITQAVAKNPNTSPITVHKIRK